MNRLLTQLYRYKFVIIGLICLIAAINSKWGKYQWRNIIVYDARGYYAYLPAIFIHYDLAFNFLETREPKSFYSPHFKYDYRANIDGKIVNKYFCGTAVAQAPFFLTCHFLKQLIKQPPFSGYEEMYFQAINVAAICYALLGLFFLNKILQIYKLDKKLRLFLLLAAVFGTNLFYYTVYESGMSHVYSFAFVAMFAYYSLLLFQKYQTKYVYLLAIAMGMIVLIRPVNALIILTLPFFAKDWKNFIDTVQQVFKDYVTLGKGLIIGFGVVSIQLIIYKIQTGHFFVYSYQKEGFDFYNPQTFNFLFSYRKGFFIYTPLVFTALFGFYYLFKNNLFKSVSILVSMSFIIYILSSWVCWWYGGSFSSRPMVEYLPIFFLLIATIFKYLQTKWVRYSYIALIIFFIGLCQLQTYQYRLGIIHYDNMNKEMYWQVFGKIPPFYKHKGW